MFAFTRKNLTGGTTDRQKHSTEAVESSKLHDRGQTFRVSVTVRFVIQ